MIDVELAGPLGAVLDDESADTEFPFTLVAEGVTHRIKVRARGKSRLRVCSFPPLRLNFVASAVAGTLFEGQDKLKLVTHCRDDARYEQDLLAEYAAYRILNLITDVSYRVRLVRMTYTDAGKEGASTGPKYGFLVESQDALGERIGAAPVDLAGVSRSGLDPAQAARVYIFHYLIGNTDWSLVVATGDEHCCHNGDLFAGPRGPYLVPFDFDLSGLVNAPYARPDPSLRISRVTRRLYRGYCVSPEALGAALDHIVALREAILAVHGALPGLSERQSDRAGAYLQQFFERARDRDRLLAQFQKRCL